MLCYKMEGLILLLEVVWINAIIFLARELKRTDFYCVNIMLAQGSNDSILVKNCFGRGLCSMS